MNVALPFSDVLEQLLDGAPLGDALSILNLRYGAIAAQLSELWEGVLKGRQPPEEKMAFLWSAHNDARNLVIVGDPAVRILGESAEMSVPVEPVADSQEAGRPIGDLPVDLEVLGTGVGNPDLSLIVRLTSTGSRVALDYQLRVNRVDYGMALYSFPEVPFLSDPQSQVRDWLQEVERVSGTYGDRYKVLNDKLAGIGVSLFESLMPEELRRRLWSIFASSSVAPVMFIISEESWIPWELIRLHDPDNRSGGIGPFLVEAFAVSRWILNVPEVSELPVRDIALVAPGDSGLSGARAECEVILSLADSGRSVVEIPAQYEKVLESMASGRYDCWHFAGHGSAIGENVELWSLRLEEFEQLAAYDLRGKARKMGQACPLVFLNACSSGRGGLGLTGMGGLAKSFIDAGAGAFIGAHWKSNDQVMYAYARAFYRYFLLGYPLCEAVRHTRLQIRDQFPGDPGWLAYTVFANPLARCIG
jgi:hypothetical protein